MTDARCPILFYNNLYQLISAITMLVDHISRQSEVNGSNHVYLTNEKEESLDHLFSYYLTNLRRALLTRLASVFCSTN
jgi:hypothetical protein